MFRILRAFAWMRWRVLMNSLERTGARDTLERLSLAVEQIGPLIALGAARALGDRPRRARRLRRLLRSPPARRVLTFEALRILLLAACGFAIVGPLLLPSMEPDRIVRLLLLPIPRADALLRAGRRRAQRAWMLIALPVVLSMPVGLAAGGRLAGGADRPRRRRCSWSSASIGLSALSTLLLHLVVRDRRRGELLALLFIVVAPGRQPAARAADDQDADRPAEHAQRQRTHARRRRAWIARTRDGGVRGRAVGALRARDTIRGATRRRRCDSCRSLVLARVRRAAARARHVWRSGGCWTRRRPARGGGRPAGAHAGSAPAALPVAAERRRRSGAAPAGAADAARTIDPARRRSSSSCWSAIVMFRQGEMQLGVISLANGLEPRDVRRRLSACCPSCRSR